MAAHAKLSPSGAHRWMRCTGSLALEAQLPAGRETNEYADEGTAAHFLAEQCLREGVDAAGFIGQAITVETSGDTYWSADRTPMEEGGPEDYREFTVDAEFAGHVQTYVDAVRVRGGAQEYEVRVDLSAALNVPDQFGTADAVVMDFETDTLEVHDLKFGRGVRVDALDNEQLMLYMLGAALRYEAVGDWRKFRVFIHQPRLGHLDDFEFDRTRLTEFAREARSKAAEAMKWLDAERIPTGVLSPSEKACQWCAVRGACSARAQFIQDSVIDHFDDVSGAPIEKYAHLMDEAELASALGMADTVENWVKAVRGEALRRALEGKELPAFKLVAGRAGPRKWVDEAEAERLMRRARLKQDEMFEKKLVTPTKAERLLAEKPRVWTKLNQLVTQSEGSLSLAPETDKRPAQKPPVAVADDFDDLVG